MVVLLHHLREVQIRLLYVISCAAVTFLVSLIYWQELLTLVIAPVTLQRFIFTNIPEPFFVSLRLSALFTTLMVLPVLFYHCWLFLAPALYRPEQKELAAVLSMSLLLLLLSIFMCYFVILPLAYHYFAGFEISTSRFALEMELRIADYVSVSSRIVVLVTAFFQLPVLLHLWSRVSRVTIATFCNMRPFVYVGALLLSSLLAPPDFFTFFIITMPMLFLFELYLLFLLYHSILL